MREICGGRNRVLSNTRAPHPSQRHGFNLGASAASHCAMAEIVVRLFYCCAARLEGSGDTRGRRIHGLSTRPKLHDRGYAGRVSRSSGRTTDSVAENAAAGAKIEHFGPAGTGTISGTKGKAYSGRLEADNSTWEVKSTYVQLRPTVWAIEVVKWRQTATAAQRAACTAASAGVTLNH